jgi:hypothetical protein
MTLIDCLSECCFQAINPPTNGGLIAFILLAGKTWIIAPVPRACSENICLTLLLVNLEPSSSMCVGSVESSVERVRESVTTSLRVEIYELFLYDS